MPSSVKPLWPLQLRVRQLLADREAGVPRFVQAQREAEALTEPDSVEWQPLPFLKARADGLSRELTVLPIVPTVTTLSDGHYLVL